MIRALRKFWSHGDDGASAVEYGLLVAGIAVVIIVAVFALGGAISKSFNDTCVAIKDGKSTTRSTAC